MPFGEQYSGKKPGAGDAADRQAAVVSRRAAVERRTCADPKRRKRLERSPARWLKWYLSETYTRPFEKPHKEIISGVMKAHRNGGRFAVAAERGIGKSVILWGMILFLKLSGKQKYPVCIPWAAPAMKRAFRFWKNALCFNPRIDADYPEFTAPFVHAKGVPQRVATTTWADTGEMTGAQLTVGDGMIILPSMIGCLGGSTINGNVRGLNHAQEDGTVLRPTIALLDDVQDRKTAKSELQVRDTVSVIDGDVAGIGEAGKDLPMLMSGNCIAPNDVMNHYLDHPDWHALKVSCILSWPKGFEDDGESRTLWDEWRELDEKGRVKFYRANRKAMTEGMKLSAPAAFKKSEKILDPLYGAMRMYYKMGHEAFWAERQQSPIESRTSQYDLNPQLVCAHMVNTPRLELPPSTTVFVGHCDINRTNGGLHFCLAGFDQAMTGHSPAYGHYPDKGDLWPKNATKQVQQQEIFKGLKELCDRIKATAFTQAGKPVQLQTLLIDAGYESDTVHRFCNWGNTNGGYPFRLLAAIGRAGHKYRVSAKNLIGKQFEEGHLQHSRDSQHKRYLMSNNDYWREVSQRAFLAEPGAAGGFTLFKAPSVRYHSAFADHICAEKLTNKYQTDDGTRWEYRHAVGSLWDWGDALTGCWVAAAMHGLSASGARRIKKRYVETRKAKVPIGG